MSSEEQNKMTNNETKLLPITENCASDSSKMKFSDAIPQIVASCVVNFVVIQAGINMAFSSILIPQLSENKSDIKIDLDSSSNLASIVTISVACGSFVCGSLMDRFGRIRLAKMVIIINEKTIANYLIGKLSLEIIANLKEKLKGVENVLIKKALTFLNNLNVKGNL